MSAAAPFDPNLLDALEASTVARVEGTVWRQILDPTSVMRPNQRGGRWNRPGTEALYSSLAPATATAEIDHLITSQPVPITRQRRTFDIAVRLSRVVDLRAEPWAHRFAYPYDPTDIDSSSSPRTSTMTTRSIQPRMVTPIRPGHRPTFGGFRSKRSLRRHRPGRIRDR